MNSKRFLTYFLLLLVLLIAVVKAEDKDIEKSLAKSSSSSKDAKAEEEIAEEVEEEDGDALDDEDEEPEPEPTKKVDVTKTTTIKQTVTLKTTPKPTTAQKVTSIKSTVNSTKPVSNIKTTNAKVNTPVSSTSVKPVPAATDAKTNVEAPVSNAVDPALAAAPAAQAAPAAPAIDGTSETIGEGSIAPGNPVIGGPISNQESNISSDSNLQDKENGGGSKVIKTTVISLVAVGAFVGVATIGVRAYNKKSGEDRGFDISDIEAQPINNDFGKSNNELSNMPPEDYNPFNIMNENQNNPYVTNSPYEYKPNYDNFTTTPFQKVETPQNNVGNRDSIFSNNENNVQNVGNDAYNFNDKPQLPQLPYTQGLPVENGYIEKPVANQIKVENFDMPTSQIQTSQMPTLVPAEPEIVITKPEESAQPQDGYKQIIPTVAKMEIIETPDFNKMTTSMIQDHINNAELEDLANIETQPQNQQQQQQQGNNYKQIVPDIQEAVIENFDIDDDQDVSAVDNITDTYRAALRATYCSTTDENRFSYRTVDSDHSLLHTMREDGNW